MHGMVLVINMHQTVFNSNPNFLPLAFLGRLYAYKIETNGGPNLNFNFDELHDPEAAQYP